MQPSTYRSYKLFVRSLLISIVCSALTSTVVAQEAADKAGNCRNHPFPPKKRFSPAPAKVDVSPSRAMKRSASESRAF